MTTFTPVQTALAMGAQNAREAGFDGLAAAFVQALKRDMGVAEATPEPPKACLGLQTAGKRHNYGSTWVSSRVMADLDAIHRQASAFSNRWETRFRNLNS